VIESAERPCRIEIEGGHKAEPARIMRDAMTALTEPI
jgi:hypothetical protein